ncbi:carbohydrate kinase [Pseudoxanthomonas sp. Root630]|uniref:carbohydrate kinase family protein n=1 Tax=Pseudoxanthomonas sp. Root630 TaxID=1736574 RepID=UPI000703ADF5|nr:carbohydrate kinase [Pseudoxanthomonas sp. Root630]KRA42474.1 fructokinase [Pseudoxanthomonas sp. Root630]
MNSPARKIVCFGEALIDMLAQPPASADAPRSFLQYAGGAPANVAVAAARLGADTHFAGMLGEDMFGDFLFDSLASAGVATDCIVRTSEAKTALAFVALDEHGERSFSFYRPPAADLLFRAAHFTPACFEGTRVFHVCSNSLTEAGVAEATYEGMRRARAGGAIVSMDLNLRPALWPQGEDPSPRLWQALAEADLVKLSREELEYLARPLGGEKAAMERLWQHHAKILVVTDGDKPITWHTPSAQGTVDTFRVTALDTTAAGDAFVGGLLFHLSKADMDRESFARFISRPDDVAAAIRFAAAVGALAVTRKGAFAAMPSVDEVNALLS